LQDNSIPCKALGVMLPLRFDFGRFGGEQIDDATNVAARRGRTQDVAGQLYCSYDENILLICLNRHFHCEKNLSGEEKLQISKFFDLIWLPVDLWHALC
jgi:hypothetical protein